MKDVCIIGYNGVGAAHAVAVHRSGYGRVTTVIDTDPDQVLKRIYTPEDPMPMHTNSWGDITESVNAFEGITISHPDWMFGATTDWVKDYDLFIIATPNEFKVGYIDQLLERGAKQILVEKPFPEIENYDERVIIGYEWVHHPGLKEIAKTFYYLRTESPINIAMFHNEEHKDHYGGPDVDLLPHCMSLALMLSRMGVRNAFLLIADYTSTMYHITPNTGQPIKLDAGTWICADSMCYKLPWVDLFDLQLLNLDKDPKFCRIIEARTKELIQNREKTDEQNRPLNYVEI